MLRVDHLIKRYGDTTAVDDLSFEVRPGVVTGFLGPNGAGKTTTMRVLLGLDRPSGGSASVNGHAYAQLRAPLREVGALLDAKAVHPGRSARNHLRALAASNQIPQSRVGEVLEFAGIAAVADRKVGQFSLGMSQRLGIAAAMLGDPPVLMFDEPVNGLDPEGIRWIREFFRALATEGRTVFVSSHLMSEMSLTADQIIVIGRGRLITQGSVADLTAGARRQVRVRAESPQRLEQLLVELGATWECAGEEYTVQGAEAEDIGRAASSHGLALFELTPVRASLEDVFMDLTADSVEYGAQHVGASHA